LKERDVSEWNARSIWQDFCQRFHVLQDAVPLFDADSQGHVRSRLIGRGVTQRPVLARSAEMDALIRGQTQLLIDDRTGGQSKLDGLIYCMGWRQGDEFIPLYIGKAETNGKQGGNLSANLTRLTTDTSKFARWGDNYAYHMGDLSACVLPGHRDAKMTDKYRQWAEALFVECPSPEPRLRQPVYFWARAWNRLDVGVWIDLGPTRLTFLEYLLIGVASIAYSGLLNREGVPRG
jgi:hypothetical protein